jgi:hypothetical protein
MIWEMGVRRMTINHRHRHVSHRLTSLATVVSHSSITPNQHQHNELRNISTSRCLRQQPYQQQTQDLYQILGVPRNATQEQIKKAFTDV